MIYPKISVIVPVYGAESYLLKCLDSVIGQTYKNLDIILVDDGSPDRCGQICDHYAAQDSRIRVIHQKNGGVSSARNAGLAVAQGEWIGWVDSDDWIEADMYEYLLNLALENQADMVQCGFFFEEKKSCEPRFVSDKVAVFNETILEITEKHLQMLSNSIWTKLYRMSTLQNIQFNTTYPIGEDLLFQLYALAQIAHIVIAPLAKYHYVQRGTSACNSPPAPERLVSYRRMLEHAKEEFYAYKSVYNFLHEELLRNNLDICSKIVRFRLDWAGELEQEIREELRHNWRDIVTNKCFSGKEKLKFTVISYFRPLYRIGLPIWRWISMRKTI